jgi:alpha-amylase
MHLPSVLRWTLFAVLSSAATQEQWRSRTIYSVLTDRFALTTDIGTACDPNAQIYCGGTWKGIQRSLDYIQLTLGFDSILISPIVKQIEENTLYGQAYHGNRYLEVRDISETTQKTFHAFKSGRRKFFFFPFIRRETRYEPHFILVSPKGYWAVDLYSLNQHFGTQQDLLDLVTEIHRRGMYIMVDGKFTSSPISLLRSH